MQIGTNSFLWENKQFTDFRSMLIRSPVLAVTQTASLVPRVLLAFWLIMESPHLILVWIWQDVQAVNQRRAQLLPGNNIINKKTTKIGKLWILTLDKIKKSPQQPWFKSLYWSIRVYKQVLYLNILSNYLIDFVKWSKF